MHLSRILAVDCGATHVTGGVLIRGPDGRYTLERFARESMDQAGPDDGGWVAGAGPALQRIVRREKWRGPCILGLPGHCTFNQLSRIPCLAARQRRKIIEFEARQGIPFALEAVAWSHVAVGSHEGHLDVALTMVKRSILEALCRQMRAAGLYAQVVMPAWSVIRHGQGYNHPDTGEALVVSIGARTTHLLYCGATRFFLRTITWGGEAVTQKIAEELQLGQPHAESLKRRVLGEPAGLPTDAPESMAVQLAVDEFARRLGGEISRSLVGLGREGESGRPALLYLDGGGSAIPDLPARLAHSLQLEIRRRDPLRHLQLGPAAAELIKAIGPAAVSGLVGLAASAAGPERGKVNLLPPALRGELFLHRWWPGIGAAALLALAGLAFAISHHRSVERETVRLTVEIEAKISALRRLDEGNRANRARVEQTNRRIAALQRLSNAKSSWVVFLGDLQSRLTKTEDVWIERLQVLPPGASETSAAPAQTEAARDVEPGSGNIRTEASPAGYRLTLGGCVLDAHTPLTRPSENAYHRARSLLAALRESPFVAGVENERFDSSRAGVLRFEITLLPAPQKLF
ncbi:MAG: pilus assembly protein PilM [Opitutaceae bacterium]|nr:pilus assembly protein PilM [Opitutaceae bacterium]